MKLPPYPQLGTAGDAHPLPTQTYGNYASWAEPPQRKTGKDWSWHLEEMRWKQWMVLFLSGCLQHALQLGPGV